MAKEVQGKERVIPKEFFLGIEILEKNGLDLKTFRRLTKRGGDDKARRIVEILNKPVSKYYEEIKSWEVFYLKYFNLPIDLQSISIPEKPKGEVGLLVIVPAISVDRVIRVMRKHFNVVMAVTGKEGKLHNTINYHGPYAGWTTMNKNPHRRLRGKFAIQAEENNLSGETLLERLIQGFKYWDGKKENLDENYLTICSSSQFANGGVPLVGTNPEKGIGGIIITQRTANTPHPRLGFREITRLK